MDREQEPVVELGRGVINRALEAFQMQGIAAFDCPRHHTAHHEGGHAITGRVLFGWVADKLEVWPIEDMADNQWSGRTFLGQTWSINADTDPAADFKYALWFFAGKISEVLLFPNEVRYASSLDEEEIVRGIMSTINFKTGIGCAYTMATVLGTTKAILKRRGIAFENCLTLQFCFAVFWRIDSSRCVEDATVGGSHGRFGGLFRGFGGSAHRQRRAS